MLTAACVSKQDDLFKLHVDSDSNFREVFFSCDAPPENVDYNSQDPEVLVSTTSVSSSMVMTSQVITEMMERTDHRQFITLLVGIIDLRRGKTNVERGSNRMSKSPMGLVRLNNR